MWLLLVVFVIALCIAAFVVLRLLFPVISLPVPCGRYTVGTGCASWSEWIEYPAPTAEAGSSDVTRLPEGAVVQNTEMGRIVRELRRITVKLWFPVDEDPPCDYLFSVYNQPAPYLPASMPQWESTQSSEHTAATADSLNHHAIPVPPSFSPLSEILHGLFWGNLPRPLKWLLQWCWHFSIAQSPAHQANRTPTLSTRWLSSSSNGGCGCGWPLVIFSHARKHTPEYNTAFCTMLASQGFVVVAPYHTPGDNNPNYPGPGFYRLLELRCVARKILQATEEVTAAVLEHGLPIVYEEDDDDMLQYEEYGTSLESTCECAASHHFDYLDCVPATLFAHIDVSSGVILAGHSLGSSIVLKCVAGEWDTPQPPPRGADKKRNTGNGASFSINAAEERIPKIRCAVLLDYWQWQSDFNMSYLRTNHHPPLFLLQSGHGNWHAAFSETLLEALKSCFQTPKKEIQRTLRYPDTSSSLGKDTASAERASSPKIQPEVLVTTNTPPGLQSGIFIVSLKDASHHTFTDLPYYVSRYWFPKKLLREVPEATDSPLLLGRVWWGRQRQCTEAATNLAYEFIHRCQELSPSRKLFWTSSWVHDALQEDHYLVESAECFFAGTAE
ncbi:hypothetical protein Pelo_13332 [Pelomyxa schiedti]|nr:hypothetical protein Pelo_13332 [Pelomyxa schiedti]